MSGPFSHLLRRIHSRQSTGGAGGDHAQEMLEQERIEKQLREQRCSCGHKPKGGCPDCRDWATRTERVTGLITDEMVGAALNAWFKSPPSETDMGLERSMRAALGAGLAVMANYTKGD